MNSISQESPVSLRIRLHDEIHVLYTRSQYIQQNERRNDRNWTRSLSELRRGLCELRLGNAFAHGRS
jgi:hypothetical protein